MKKNLNNQKATSYVKIFLKLLYVDSEVTSGEFIHTVRFNPSDKFILNKSNVKQGIQDFLDWDESPEEFDVFQIGDVWYTTQHNFPDWVDDVITYKGIAYPIMHPTVTIDDEQEDDWMHCYPIAPECLLDALMENTPDYDKNGFEGEEADLDDGIYHYIEDQYWHLPLEVICKEHLDTPMTLVKEDES